MESAQRPRGGEKGDLHTGVWGRLAVKRATDSHEHQFVSEWW